MADKKQEQVETETQQIIVHKPINFYAPAKAVKVMQNNMTMFGSIGLFFYLLQFGFVVYALNAYADGTQSEYYETEASSSRLLCGRSLASSTAFSLDADKLRCPARLTGRLLPCAGKVGEQASEVLDTAILLLLIFHFIEWIRYTIFLASVFIGVNLIQVFYGLILNSLFGIAVYIFAHIVRLSEDGKACSDQQKGRGLFLVIDIVCFWIFFWWQINPAFFFRCISRDKINDSIKDSDASDSDDG